MDRPRCTQLSVGLQTGCLFKGQFGTGGTAVGNIRSIDMPTGINLADKLHLQGVIRQFPLLNSELYGRLHLGHT